MNTNNYKKIGLILLFLGGSIFIAFIIYITFFKSDDTSLLPEKQDQKTITGGLPETEEGAGQIIDQKETDKLPKDEDQNKPTIKIDQTAQGGVTRTTKISNVISQEPTLNKNGNLQYYNKEDGKFYYLDSNNNAIILSDKVFHNIQNITWSPIKNKVILEYPDGSNILYDFNQEKQVTLPKQWKDFNFSSSGNQIVSKSIGLNPDNSWLVTSNEDGTRAKIIEQIGKNADTVYPSWSPNNQTIAMYTKGVDFNRQEVFFLGLNNENFKSTTIEGRGFQYQWQPKGEKLLYSVYSSSNEMKPMLWIVDAQGENIGNNRKSLNLETWSSKCTFANSKELYCAVPKSLEPMSGVFPELADSTVDNLYKIDLNTGLKKLIAIPDKNFNMSNLIISNDNEELFFTDSKTNNIHKIQLK
jgi:hypothetical protein